MSLALHLAPWPYDWGNPPQNPNRRFAWYGLTRALRLRRSTADFTEQSLKRDIDAPCPTWTTSAPPQDTRSTSELWLDDSHTLGIAYPLLSRDTAFAGELVGTPSWINLGHQTAADTFDDLRYYERGTKGVPWAWLEEMEGWRFVITAW